VGQARRNKLRKLAKQHEQALNNKSLRETLPKAKDQAPEKADPVSETTAPSACVFIDYSAVGEVERDTERFKLELDEMSTSFCNQVFVRGVSVHEAGHAYCFFSQGAPALFVKGPRMFYDPDSKEVPFPSFGASVEEGASPITVPRNEEGLRMMVNRFVAGGVASQTISNPPQEQLQKEIQRDWNEFLRMCKDLEDTGFAKIHDARALWNNSWDGLRGELVKNPSLISALTKTADVVESALYAWKGTAISIKFPQS
jgi:hypothetical protein